MSIMHNQVYKMKQLSEQEIQDNLKEFYKLMSDHITGDRYKKLLEFYIGIELELITAPASPRISNHNCFPGGYLDHVLRVVKAALVMDRVWDKFEQSRDYTTEELVFSAINHDLGKLGTNEEPFYLPQDQLWQIEKNGVFYKYNPKIPHMRIADRSLYYLQKANIPVTEREFLAIKLHDGLYEEANKSYYITYNSEFEIQSNLPYILHQADLMASRVETQKK